MQTSCDDLIFWAKGGDSEYPRVDIYVHPPRALASSTVVPYLIRLPYLPRKCGHSREAAFGEREN